MSVKSLEDKPSISDGNRGPAKRSRLYRALHLFAPNPNPPPAGGSLDDAKLIPEATAGWFSVLTWNWITPLLSLGYARPLEASDLYRLQDRHSASVVADRIVTSFEARRVKAEQYNARLTRGEISPGLRGWWWTIRGNRLEREKRWREKDGRRKASLLLAMNDSIKWWFWIGGFIKVIGDTAQITNPLILKAIINFAAQSYFAHRNPNLSLHAPPVGKGVGLAFGLLALQLVSSLCTHHFFYRATITGVLLRGGLISAIYSRSLRLTTRARSTLTNGKLINHISTDVSRIDFCAGFFHMAWTSPIQMIICLILLLVNLGPSALAGFGLFFLVTPPQTLLMRSLFKIRQKSMIWTDKRAKLLQEILGGAKVIKFFAWEESFLRRISEYRRNEMAYLRSLLLARSANSGVALSLPAVASVLSFVAYSLSGHQLTPGIIFSSLTLFNLLRLPLMLLPVSFSSIADALNALERLYAVFEAEVLEDTQIRDPSLPVAVRVENASFTWDSPPPEVEHKKARKRFTHRFSKTPSPDSQAAEGASEKEQPKVFSISNLNFEIPRGILLAIVGPVGAGKSSLLQALIGEMRKTAGTVAFGGSVAYCAQTAWIQNATIRENICFGREFDPEKYWNAVRCACLEPDLEMLPNGDLTEVGERGITLSGGQKQRVNICRAIYCDTDVQIFDDPLSALDAHVGKAVFQNVFQNGSTGKTRILVTHALHFLPKVDYIFTVVDGQIAERGTYAELIAKEGEFAKLVMEFGSQEASSSAGENAGGDKSEEAVKEVNKSSVLGAGIMQAEERIIGAVGGSVYGAYFRAAKGVFTTPFLLLFLVLFQGATVMSSYWLVYWQEMKFHRSPAFYMGVYAALAVGQMVALFLMGATLALVTYLASQRLHRDALRSVMRAPMSFFETTPLGRIMNRFSKDVDTLDNLLVDSFRMFLATCVQILGAIILVAVLLPWFLVPVFCISFLYTYAAYFYRASARELKRLDAILRSSLYSHFSESLSGIGTIRAYGESERFQLDNQKRIDIENRAYWLTWVNQRWLAVRIDFLGAMLLFSVALLTVGARNAISPAQAGLVLSFFITVQFSFGWLVRQTAEVENNMNSVERIVHYATGIEQEAAHKFPDTRCPESWPSVGNIEFSDVVLKYRPELPAVLKGLSISIQGGEKIGIVGRTGAGKSSLVAALYRLVELSSGAITIDGIDIATIGLNDLRKAISIIPQDPLLFSGTIRSNLDPFGIYDDARLWEALKRSHLIDAERVGSVETSKDDSESCAVTPLTQFTLDTLIEDEGNNLSVGQRSLVSLARALVKDTKILILDEATASVDFETDRHIQDTIAHEFQDRTILCIAHRLRTIISYDKICVLDAGQIAEFGTPAELYNFNRIFHGMCERSSITPSEIQYAAKARIGSV